jgi:glycolate oxidase
VLDSKIYKELRRIVGAEHVLPRIEDLTVYASDASFLEHRPGLVVLPSRAEQVAAIVQLAEIHRIPIVPRGAGTGLSGGSVASRGGIALVLTRMNRLLEIDRDNMTATAEAGLITGELQKRTEAHGLFYPPDPASVHQCTIGGNVATNAGGLRCVKYGVTRDYVLGLSVVMMDGRRVHLGGKTVRSGAQNYLMRLLIGSEGTLGIISAVTVRLIARPRAFRTAMVGFARLDDAAIAVQRSLRSGVRPAALELMDRTTINTVESYLHLGLPVDADAVLLIEVDGVEETSVDRDILSIAQICRDVGASDVQLAATDEEREALWSARRAVGPSAARLAPNQLGEDISVPLKAIPETIRRLQQLPARFGLPMVIYGHAGDGNLHPNILFDQRNGQHLKTIPRIVREIFRIAVDMGGTLSGEHGVGLTKRPYLSMAVPPDSLAVMRSIKQSLDPACILNPDKVFRCPPAPRIG